jgi:hypothetical protein
VPDTVDTTGYYNHYSALRSYEDLLGLTSGGTDGYGHLGFAAASGLTPFGQDIFQPDVTPTITTDPQSQSVVTGGTLTFTAAADITTPTVQWQLSIDGGNSWFNVGGLTTASVTTGPLTAFVQGWEIRAVFTNHMGSATTNPATITVLPPTTNVVLPSNGASLSGSQYLDAFASPGTTQVQYEVSGGPNNYVNQVISGSGATYYGWIGSWNTTSVPNGTYTLNSVATSGGLTGTSTGITVIVNNPPPTTNVVLPSNGATLSGSQYLDAFASAGTTQVQYEVSGGPNNYVNQVISGSGPTYYGWIGSWNTTSVPNGTYSLASVASYTGGVSGTSLPITVIVNN